MSFFSPCVDSLEEIGFDLRVDGLDDVEDEFYDGGYVLE